MWLSSTRRPACVAYLLTWAWQEHVENAKLRGQKPTREIVFLIDEVEAHLHPQWQRRIVPALLNVMVALTGNLAPKVQLVVSTHAPLVLASVEPTFDAREDAWFDLDLEAKRVALRKRTYVRRGEVGNWLVSEAFDLKSPRSLEGERAVAAAEALMQARTRPAKGAVEEADRGLRAAGLPDIDTFWVRWRSFRDQVLESGAKARPKTPKKKPK
jgi:hypothetical protein